MAGERRGRSRAGTAAEEGEENGVCGAAAVAGEELLGFCLAAKLVGRRRRAGCPWELPFAFPSLALLASRTVPRSPINYY